MMKTFGDVMEQRIVPPVKIKRSGRDRIQIATKNLRQGSESEKASPLLSANSNQKTTPTQPERKLSLSKTETPASGKSMKQVKFQKRLGSDVIIEEGDGGESMQSDAEMSQSNQSFHPNKLARGVSFGFGGKRPSGSTFNSKSS